MQRAYEHWREAQLESYDEFTGTGVPKMPARADEVDEENQLMVDVDEAREVERAFDDGDTHGIEMTNVHPAS